MKRSGASARPPLRRRVAALVAALALGGCASAGPVAEGPGGGMMGDPQIADISLAANQGEVETSQPVRTAATSPAVRQFAEMMVTDHTAAIQRQQQLQSRSGIAASPSELSQQLRANSRQTVQNLQTYRGAELDRTYMQTQVAMHRWTLDSLDNVLIPSTRNAQMRALLTQMRGTVAAHLQQAQQILGTLR